MRFDGMWQDILGIIVTDYLLVSCTICLVVMWSILVVVQSSYLCFKHKLEPLSQDLKPHCTRTCSMCFWAKNRCFYVRAPLAGLGAVLGALMQEIKPHCTRPSLVLLKILPKTSKIVQEPSKSFWDFLMHQSRQCRGGEVWCVGDKLLHSSCNEMIRYSGTR